MASWCRRVRPPRWPTRWSPWLANQIGVVAWHKRHATVHDNGSMRRRWRNVSQLFCTRLPARSRVARNRLRVEAPGADHSLGLVARARRVDIDPDSGTDVDGPDAPGGGEHRN